MKITKRLRENIKLKAFSGKPISVFELNYYQKELDKIEDIFKSLNNKGEESSKEVIIPQKQFFLNSDDLIDITMDDIEFLKASFILKNGANLLVSEHGIGKTLFSIFLAQSLKIKKPLFILFEDYNNLQLNRYKQGLKGIDYKLMTLKMWESWCLQVKNNIEKLIEIKSMNQVMQDNNPMNKFYKQYNRVKRTLMSDKNILDEEKYDFAMCYMLLLEDLKDEIDFVVLDTYLGLQDGKKFHRNHLKRIISNTVDKDITLLILHHTNSQKAVEGSKELERAVDYVYLLEKSDEETDEKSEILTLRSTKERYTERINLKINKTKVSTFVADFEILGDNYPKQKTIKKGLENILEDIFNSYDGTRIGKDELIEKLTNGHPEEVNPGTLTNKLTKLKDKGVISMTEEGSWNNITIN